MVYQITYTVEPNGLILYQFVRCFKSSQPNEVTVKETEEEKCPARQPSRVDADYDVWSPVYVTTDYDDAVDIGAKVVFMVAVAKTLKTSCDLMNSNPRTKTSLSVAGACACASFLLVAGNCVATEMVYAAESEDLEQLKSAMYDFELALETYYGEDVVEEILAAFKSNDPKVAEEILKQIQNGSFEYDKAAKAQPPIDPLVIDLGNNGIELTTLENGVNFDLDSGC